MWWHYVIYNYNISPISKNDGKQYNDTNNNNIINYLEFNGNRLLDLAKKNDENLVEALINNAIDTAATSSSRSSGSIPKWYICVDCLMMRNIRWCFSSLDKCSLFLFMFLRWLANQIIVSHCDSRPSNKAVCNREQGTHAIMKETQCDTQTNTSYTNINGKGIGYGIWSIHKIT